MREGDQCLPARFGRRRFMELSGLVAAGGLLGACGTDTSSAAKELSLLQEGENNVARAIAAFARERERATDVKHNVSELAWDSLLPKLRSELAAGRPTLDIFWNDIEFSYQLWPNLEPLNELMADAGYSMERFFPNLRDYSVGIGDEPDAQYTLPLQATTTMTFFRDDEIEAMPTTWADYEALLAEYTGNGRYALAAPGIASQQVYRFLARFWSIKGTQLLTEDWQPLIAGDEAVAALDMLIRHSRYAPEGFFSWELADAANAFAQGEAMVAEMIPSQMLLLLGDPEKNRIGDAWSGGNYPENGTSQLLTHCMMILKGTPDPKQAFAFLDYATAPEQARRSVTEFDVNSPQPDAWTAAIETDDHLREKFYKPWSEQLSRARPLTRGLPQWIELVTVLGENLQSAMTGDVKPRAALEDTAAKWTRAIDQSRPKFPYRELPGAA